MNSIAEVTALWKDSPEVHQLIAESFSEKVNEVPRLRELRDYIEKNNYGYGERALYWLWKLVMDEMPKGFTFCEIGVHKSQTLCLIAILSDMQQKYHHFAITGISPMDGTEVGIESDYYNDMFNLFDRFNLPAYVRLLKGLSTDPEVLWSAKTMPLFNAFYIDGGHDFQTVTFDLTHYTPLIAPGGFLVLDDACSDMSLPEGYFKGHRSVTDAVNAWEPQHPEFRFLFSCSHNKVYQRI